MKKMNKKGFTIIELVIVIAVIAILAAVMIPTFGGIIKKANQSAVQQTAASLYKQAIALDLADGVQDGFEGDATAKDEDDNLINKIVEIEDKAVTYTVTNGVLTEFSYTDNAKKIKATTNNGSDWTFTDVQ